MATVGPDAKSAREEYLKKYLSSDADKTKKKSKKKKQQSSNARGMKIIEDDAFIAVAPESSNIPSDEDDREDLRREIEVEAKLAEMKPKFKKGTFQSIDDSEVPSLPGTSKYYTQSTRHGLCFVSTSELFMSVLHIRISYELILIIIFMRFHSGLSSFPNDTFSRYFSSSFSDHSNIIYLELISVADSDDSPSPGRCNGHQDDDLSPEKGRSKRVDENKVKPKRNVRSDEDLSPKRARAHVDSNDGLPVKRRGGHMDSNKDLSPRRKKSSKGRDDSDDDFSPKRVRRALANSADDHSPRTLRKRMDSDSDLSPRRIRKNGVDSDGDLSPPRSRGLNGKMSPRRRSHYRGDSRYDTEAVKRSRNSDADQSPRRESRRRHDSGSDISPTRVRSKQRFDSGDHFSARDMRNDGRSVVLKRTYDSRRNRRDSDDSDASPQRRRHREGDAQTRSGRDVQLNGSQKLTENNDSDTDSSPRRRQRQDPSGDSRRKHDRSDAGDSDSGERRDGLTKTLDGKKAGLQTADALRDEMKQLKERENKVFENLDKDISGRDAEVVRRSKMTGKGRETREDREKKEREAKKQEELNQKYKQWNKGVAQIKNRAEKLEEMARVVDEGFTRHADNEAMNVHMKQILHAEDPMLEYVQKKKLKKEIKTGLVYPTYKGGWPPNRFSIPPGYRWDGVDRSNGFEAQIAKVSNRKVANEREYYENISKYE
ncbi:unnamed protein product [Anisakis simplex]|uniref:BUD13 homolog n=1 Tax=Anisakis simplex TaxID=6269 RepID=A0A0M3JXG3_ANISI|nr:unnamed protein product [Anisakis simplex]